MLSIDLTEPPLWQGDVGIAHYKHIQEDVLNTQELFFLGLKFFFRNDAFFHEAFVFFDFLDWICWGLSRSMHCPGPAGADYLLGCFREGSLYFDNYRVPPLELPPMEPPPPPREVNPPPPPLRLACSRSYSAFFILV